MASRLLEESKVNSLVTVEPEGKCFASFVSNSASRTADLQMSKHSLLFALLSRITIGKWTQPTQRSTLG